MNGTRMLSPGPRTLWNFPSRSTTQACCCGTTFTACATKTTASASTTRARTSPFDASIMSGISSVSGRGDDEPVADHAPDHVGPRTPGRAVRVGELHLPGRAPVARDGAVGLVPVLDLDAGADVQREVGLLAPGPRPAPAPDQDPPGDGAGGRGQQLQGERAAGQRDHPARHATERQHQQVEGLREHFHDAQDQRRQPPCLVDLHRASAANPITRPRPSVHAAAYRNEALAAIAAPSKNRLASADAGSPDSCRIEPVRLIEETLEMKKTLLSFALAAALVPLAMPASAQTVVRIGHVAPLTVGIAHLGKDNENGARLAIEELNAKRLKIGGKEVRFELLSEDDAADPKQGTAAAQKLVDAGVVGVIGHLNSGTTIPASRIYY